MISWQILKWELNAYGFRSTESGSQRIVLKKKKSTFERFIKSLLNIFHGALEESEIESSRILGTEKTWPKKVKLHWGLENRKF